MPRYRVPGYRFHKASGQAVVTLGGRDVYLGEHSTPESRARYDRAIAEWLASGRAPGAGGGGAEFSVADLILAYWTHAKVYYRKAGVPTSEQHCIRSALRPVNRLYGELTVTEVKPIMIKAVREGMIAEGLSRGVINKHVSRIRRCFKWGVAEGLVHSSVLHGLQAVDPLRRDRCDARETEPVRPIADAVVHATLEHLSEVVAAMVRVQRLTGMRPGETCAMTTGQLDTSGQVWLYEPTRHKTEHHGIKRTIPIRPRAQAILRGYLREDLAAPIFSPRESEQRRALAMRAANTTPFTPSRRKRDARRKQKPRRELSDRYTSSNYAQAVRRGCEEAGVPRWSPNQLRHTRATEIRKEHGLDAAGAVLGHTRLETTQIYAERAVELACNVAARSG